ncbi:tetratricopeptide repeat protein [Ursidibacter sp. B-7004-1]
MINKILLLIIFICSCILVINLINKKDNAKSLFGKDVVIVSSTRIETDEYGNDVVVSYWDEEKFNLVHNNAKRGEIVAQATLGYLYLAGEFVGEDHSKAEFWLKKAADENDAEAQFNLAYLYQKLGKLNDSIFWYRKSAQLNYSKAQLNLALLLGDQSDFDVNEIVELLEMAVKNGNKESYFPLAWWYLNELRLNKEQEGLRLLKIAVDYEDKDAEYTMAELYETGDLVEKNLEKSKELYLRAQMPGSLEAIEKLKEPKFN